MAGTIYSGTYTSGIYLSDPATQRPVTVAASGKITDTNADAVYGSAAFAWNIVNRGTVQSTGTVGYGIHLADGGTITNIAVGVGPTSGGLIEGYGGILIEGAAGVVSNLGTIEGAGANTNGVWLTAGGSVTNGSATDTAALISDARHGVKISGGVGTVTNFGTIENVANHSNIVLDSGAVINGSSTSTAALITGSGAAIYVQLGTGTVVNFATIKSASAVSLLHGGRVANGAVGSTAAQIVGTASIGVFIQGAAGTVANFATIQSADYNAAIEMLGGGSVINGSAADTTALIANTFGGQAIYFDSLPGTVTNFGTINGPFSAISLAAGGNVINGSGAATGALIEGVSTPISISGGRGTVVNFGSIEPGSTLYSAVDLKGGGMVVNGQSGSGAGFIEGNAAVSVSGGTGTVINYGTLSATSTLFSRAVTLYAGGTATNFGAIDGWIVAQNVHAAVKNAGTVSNTVYLSAGGNITNSVGGVISSGTGYAVLGKNTPVAVTNFGTIETTSTSGIAIHLSAGGSVTNYPGAVISSPLRVAVFGYNAPTSVTNLGTIFGVGLSGGGNVTNGRTGSTMGLIQGSLSVSGGPSTITNFGTITSGTGVGAGGTIRNFGIIKSTGTNSSGVSLDTGAILVNSPGGFVASASGEGVLGFSSVTITNSGTIRETGTLGMGISLDGGGTIANGRSGSKVGLVEGSGVGVSTASGVVTNFGTIAGATGFVGTGVGNTTLINYGTVASTGGAAGIAVDMVSALGSKLVVEEPGSVLKGLVEGGGRGEIEFLGAGVASMTGVSGFETILLGNGVGHSLTVTSANFGVSSNTITVFGGNAGNTIDASAVTATLPALSLVIHGGAGKDVLAGGAGNDTFVFAASALTAADTINGGGGTRNELQVTTAGTIAAAGVTGVEIYQLANGGANTLVVTNANFTGVPAGEAITVHGGTGGNTIDGSGLTGVADKLVIYGGAGADLLKGGAGNDVFVFSAAALTASDTINGGSGTNELLMTSAGTVNAAKISGVETCVLADGGPNTLTLLAGNFTGVTGSTITVSDGNDGNTVSLAPGVPATDHIVVYAGTGADKLTGGAGNDVFHAGGNTMMTGGGGTNEFVFNGVGTNTIADFTGPATNEIVFGNSGFHLGLSGASATPKPLPVGLFVADAAGAFTKTSERFAYGTTTGKLYYSATGTTAGEHLVATLAGTPPPGLAASHLFFIS